MRRDRKWSWRRFLTRTILIILGVVLLLIIVASPLTKYLVEKYDVKYTGREITIGRAIVNPLAGSLGLRNFRMYESGSDSVFVSAGKFAANISILKLIRGIYDVSSIKLNKPEINIIREDTVFNFSDLITKFATAGDTVPEEVLKLNIRNIEVNDGVVHYSERKIPVNLTISEINFSSKGMFWDVDTINGEFSLVPGEGQLSGDFMFNQKSSDYRLALNLAGFGIKQFEPYLEEMATGKANLSAYIDLDVKTHGNAKELLKGQASGSFELRDLHFGPDSLQDFMSMKRMLIQFRDVDLAVNRFYFDSILIDRLDILYQKYDTLDNFRRMFRTYLAKIAKEKVKEAADTVDFLVDLIGSDYYIQSFALKEARIEFNDYSIAEKFTMAIDPLNIKSDTIDKADKRVKVLFDGRLKPFGKFAATLSMNPSNDENFDFNYEFRDIAASMFNPYLTSFTSYQLDHGTIEMHGKWSVNNAEINSLNHFLVIDPQDTKRVRGKDTKWVPLPLIMAFVRERGSFIDYQIPVKGNLNDPSFKLGDIISDILRNILVKPATTPYRMEVQNVQNKVEKTLTVSWKMRQSLIEDDQEKFMKNIADFLKDNPEASIVVQPIFHEEKERENLLLFEAKKKYFFLNQNKEVAPLEKDDSMKVEKMSTKDKNFVNFLNNSVRNPEFMTLQAKCYRFIGGDLVDKKYQELIEKRQQAFMNYFRDNSTENRVDILKVKNQVPYNWFSYYDINYKGDIPESLSKAFDKLYELNSEPPRRRIFDQPSRR